MTTTISVTATPSFDQVVRLKISRSAYTALAESLGDGGHVRLAYDGETLEIMSPGSLHEIVSRVVSGLLESLSLEWEVNLTDLGSTRFKPVSGEEFEPDGAWYIDFTAKVRDLKTIDLTVDAPPDLLLETDITTDSSDKLPIFASMRVPEVWHYSLNGFAAKALQDDGTYVAIETSRVIAGLPIAEIAKRVEDEASRSNMVAFRRSWQQWLREHRQLHDMAH